MLCNDYASKNRFPVAVSFMICINMKCHLELPEQWFASQSVFHETTQDYSSFL